MTESLTHRYPELTAAPIHSLTGTQNPVSQVGAESQIRGLYKHYRRCLLSQLPLSARLLAQSLHPHTADDRASLHLVSKELCMGYP